MADTIRLEPWTEADGRIELAATLELAGKSHRLWWRVPAAWRDALTTWADPFVIGVLFPMMAVGGEVEVLGPVSPSLLANLETYNKTWMLWAPDRYRPLRIWSREEAEPPAATEPETAVAMFSGGVDSCFTALRHARGLAGRNTRRIGAGLTLFGFDILTHEKNVAERYAQLREASASMLGSLNIPMVELDSNFRTLPQFWRHSHASQLASALSLFGKRFGRGLIPNTTPNDHLDYADSRLGSHPLSDPMMSSAGFPIADDGGTHRRFEKVEAIADWPEAMQHLRVCFGAAGNVGNCGRCEKCYRTAMSFRVIGRDPPAGLPRDLSPRALRKLRVNPILVLFYWRDLAEGARLRGQEAEPWGRAIRSVVRRAERTLIARRLKEPFIPLRGRVRQLFRGTTKSRKQIAAERAAQRDAAAASTAE